MSTDNNAVTDVKTIEFKTAIKKTYYNPETRKRYYEKVKAERPEMHARLKAQAARYKTERIAAEIARGERCQHCGAKRKKAGVVNG